jgi:catechol 2,3-dioxygenase-like lactoylglutathione lyase family enzyme
MPVQLKKQAIDLGIVTCNGPEMLAFYKDLLGFRHEADTPFGTTGIMHRLWCGDSLIKICVPDPAPSKAPEPGMIAKAAGYRYWTMIVDNLENIVDDCVSAGRDLVVPIKEIRDGVWIAIVADPDGNLVEFVRYD